MYYVWVKYPFFVQYLPRIKFRYFFIIHYQNLNYILVHLRKQYFSKIDKIYYFRKFTKSYDDLFEGLEFFDINISSLSLI